MDYARYKTADLIKTLQDLTKELGRVPTLEEWKKTTKINEAVIDSHFCIHINRDRRNPVAGYVFNMADYQGWECILKRKERIGWNHIDENWRNFQIMSGVGEYEEYTKEALFPIAAEVITHGNALTPLNWPLPLATVVKYYQSWDEFVDAVVASGMVADMDIDYTNKSCDEVLDAYFLK